VTPVLELLHLKVVPASPTMLAAVAGGAVFAGSCMLGGHSAEPAADPGGTLTATQVRSCLETRPQDEDGEDGLVFRTTRRSSEHFVGVLMMDLTTETPRTATVGIAIYDDPDLLDAYEERARQDPDEEVRRVQNAVVSTHGHFTGRLAEGARWVRGCLG
jgi:hypothetical protein